MRGHLAGSGLVITHDPKQEVMPAPFVRTADVSILMSRGHTPGHESPEDVVSRARGATDPAVIPNKRRRRRVDEGSRCEAAPSHPPGLHPDPSRSPRPPGGRARPRARDDIFRSGTQGLSRQYKTCPRRPRKSWILRARATVVSSSRKGRRGSLRFDQRESRDLPKFVIGGNELGSRLQRRRGDHCVRQA